MRSKGLFPRLTLIACLAFATAVSTGRSLVLNPDGSIRQANVGEPVLVPP